MNSKVEIVKNHFWNQLHFDIRNKLIVESGIEGYLLTIAENFDDLQDKEIWLENTLLLLTEMKQSLQYCAYLDIGMIGGLAGKVFAVELLSKKTNMFKKVNSQLKLLLVDLVRQHLAVYPRREIYVQNYDLVSGMAGAGLCLLYCENDMKIYQQSIQDILDYMVNVGNTSINGFMVMRENQLRKEDMDLFPNGSVDFGLAHGMVGPLLFLATAYKKGYREQAVKELIEKLIDIYFRFGRIDKNGVLQWPSQLSSLDFLNDHIAPDIRRHRMSWCYGSIGITAALNTIGEILQKSWIEEMMERNIIAIAKLDHHVYRLNSPILCHGYASIAVILNLFYRKNNNHLIKERIDLEIGHILADYDEKSRYGFKNRGEVEKDGKLITEEMEQFEMLYGASGIILALTSLTKKNTMWEYQLGIKGGRD